MILKIFTPILLLPLLLTMLNNCSGGGDVASTPQVWQNKGPVIMPSLSSEENNIQEPTVIYEGGAQLLSGNVFKIWYSGGWSSSRLYYAESTDGLTWTKYAGNPVVSDHTRCSVLKHGATYYMFAQAWPSGVLDLLTSADGITWTLDTAAVLPAGSAGGWEEAITNTFVWIEEPTWYMLYEGSGFGRYQIGLATSIDGRRWRKHGGNPVLASESGSVSGPWVTKLGSTYYGWFHVASVGNLPSDIAGYKSSDLITWVRDPVSLAYPRTTADEGVNTNVGQAADPTLVEVNGSTYMFYDAYADGRTPSGRIKLAIAPMPLSQLVLTREGIDNGSN